MSYALRIASFVEYLELRIFIANVICFFLCQHIYVPRLEELHKNEHSGTVVGIIALHRHDIATCLIHHVPKIGQDYWEVKSLQFFTGIARSFSI